MIEVLLSIVFYLSLALIVYSYALYPLILYVWKAVRTDRHTYSDAHLPSVSLLIAAYNEEKVIVDKIHNIFTYDYPAELLEVLIGLDACTDNTAELLEKVARSNVNVFIFDNRRGKSAVLNELAARASNEILVFSDANTIYNADTVRKLVRHFSDPSVGGVCGKLELIPLDSKISSAGESIYWRYENIIKRLEGSIRTTIGATGAVYAIRRALYRRLPVDKIVMDDFVLPLGVVEKGYRTIYEAEAVGYEKTTESMQHEFSRKVRIGVGNFVGLSEIKGLLKPRWRFVAFALWSHKIIRWILPFCMIAALCSNVLLVLIADAPLYAYTFAVQAIFYMFALTGFLLYRLGMQTGIFGYPYFFVSMHYALLVGFIRFISNKVQPMWMVQR
jgi:poly-beta-1,6-N-acetyl-D-glucosamine synthase